MGCRLGLWVLWRMPWSWFLEAGVVDGTVARSARGILAKNILNWSSANYGESALFKPGKSYRKNPVTLTGNSPSKENDRKITSDR